QRGKKSLMIEVTSIIRDSCTPLYWAVFCTLNWFLHMVIGMTDDINFCNRLKTLFFIDSSRKIIVLVTIETNNRITGILSLFINVLKEFFTNPLTAVVFTGHQAVQIPFIF